MNSYAKCFLVQMKVTNQDEEQAKYCKYLQQIHCQLNPNFLFRLKKTKNCQYLFKNLIKICKDFFFYQGYWGGQLKLCSRKNSCFNLQVFSLKNLLRLWLEKIITLCEEWQVSRAYFDATHLKKEFSADLYTYTAHMNKHTHFI